MLFAWPTPCTILGETHGVFGDLPYGSGIHDRRIRPGGSTGDRVLDMCAAPGGKSLLLAEAMGDAGRLVANELSPTRRAKLKTILEDCLPGEQRKHIQVTGHDATRWGLHEPDHYDRVLLDAPCSSERHVLGKEKERAVGSQDVPSSCLGVNMPRFAPPLEPVNQGAHRVHDLCPEQAGKRWGC